MDVAPWIAHSIKAALDDIGYNLDGIWIVWHGI